MSTVDTRFKILALATFAPVADEALAIPPQVVDRASLDEVMGKMALHLDLNVEKSLCPEGRLTFRFDRLKSLHPDGIVTSHPFFKQLSAAKEYIKKARQDGEPNDRIRQELRQWPELPPIELQAPPVSPKTPNQHSQIDHILAMVALDSATQTGADSIRTDTQQLDAIACGLLNALFDDKRFQTMESAWRGLRLLLQQGVDTAETTVSISSVQPEALEANLEALSPHLIADLPNVILLDLPFDNTPLAASRLEIAARWAATWMVPIIAWVPASFFQLTQWSRLGTLPYIPNHLGFPAYAKFNRLRQSSDGHWICLTCNRFLVRYPYGEENPPRHTPFVESGLNWIAPVWGLGTLISQSVSRHRWPTGFCDKQRFLIQDLAFHTDGHLPPMVSETLFDQNRLSQFVEVGFTPLATAPKKDWAFFPRAVTVSGQSLAYQLLLTQATQFILWCKDHLPAEIAPDDLKRQLESYLTRFSEQSDPPLFSSIVIDIETQATQAESGIPLTIQLMPAAAFLQNRRPIELRLNW